MAGSVALSEVAAQLAVYGDLATLVTVNADGAPHIGTVRVRVGPGGLEFGVGAGTRTNIRAHPSVSLSWLRDDEDYQLIVDGLAIVVDEPGPDGLHPTEVAVRTGILHRVAGRATGGPSCRSLADRSPV